MYKQHCCRMLFNVSKKTSLWFTCAHIYQLTIQSHIFFRGILWGTFLKNANSVFLHVFTNLHSNTMYWNNQPPSGLQLLAISSTNYSKETADHKLVFPYICLPSYLLLLYTYHQHSFHKINQQPPHIFGVQGWGAQSKTGCHLILWELSL